MIVDRSVDEDEFDEMFRRLFPVAGRLAFRIVGDRELAEDIAAEACARAVARWNDISVLRHRDAWVLRVTTNLALDAVRRKRPPDLVRPPGIDADELTVLRAALASALRALPRRQREVVVLRYLVGLPDRQVAETLGIDDGTVRTHARRGLHALRGVGLLEGDET